VLCSLIGIVVLAQTGVGLLVGVRFSIGQLIVFTGIFVVLAAIAIGLTVSLIRNVAEPRQTSGVLETPEVLAR